MSYEPTIVIQKRDLDRHVELLEQEQYDSDEEISRVAKHLLEVSKYEVLTFGKLQLVICQPEHTSFNSAVRDRLRELNVFFQLDN